MDFYLCVSASMRDAHWLWHHILSAPVCTCVSAALDSQGSSSIWHCLPALLPQPWSTGCICTLVACMWFWGLTWAPIQWAVFGNGSSPGCNLLLCSIVYMLGWSVGPLV